MSQSLHSIHDQVDAKAVAAQFNRVIDALAEKLPVVADHLDHARADLLAFTACPKEIWRQILSNKGTRRPLPPALNPHLDDSTCGLTTDEAGARSPAGRWLAFTSH